MALLLERFELVRIVGHFKRENGLGVEDLSREAAVLRRIEAQAEGAGQSRYLPGLLEIYREIFEQAKAIQK